MLIHVNRENNDVAICTQTEQSNSRKYLIFLAVEEEEEEEEE